MTQARVAAVATAAIMTTLLEAGHPCPKSIIHMALEETFPVIDVYAFMKLCEAMKQLDWIKVTPNTLGLTTLGFVKANEMQAAQDAQA